MRGKGASHRTPLIEMPELDAQDRRLHGVEPLVARHHDVLVLPLLPEVTQHPDAIGNLFVHRDDRSGIPRRAEVLAGIETERSYMAERTAAAPLVFGPVRL